VVSPPETKSLDNFLVEAKKSRWIESMLHKKHYMAGMLTYLAKEVPELYVQVANNNRLDLVKAVPTIVTLSMASYLGLNDTQLELLRSWLGNECGLNLEYSATELKRIDREAGVSTKNEPTCDSYDYYYRDDKDPETCRYWNSELAAEICVETDIHLSHLFREAKEKGTELNEIPTLDYLSPGLPDGCTMLLGGDHGDHCFRFHAKMHFSSPQERKHRKDLSYRCPMIQIAHMDCAKDRYDLLAETIIPKLNVIVVHDKTNLEQRKSYLVPDTIDMDSIVLTLQNKLVYRIDGSDEQVEEDVDLWEDSSYFNLTATKVISNWNDLYVGDLEFLALCLGMVSSTPIIVSSANGTGELSIATITLRNNGPMLKFLNVIWSSEQILSGMKKGAQNKQPTT
jgi:hypothetical protein